MTRNILVTFSIAALLAACTRENLSRPDVDIAAPITVSVTDGGYLPGTTDATRTAENGYVTEFTSGDACGLYIVREGEVVCANLKVTAVADGSGILWEPEPGTKLAGGFSDERYYLYYPYQEEMTDMIDPAAAEELSFFAPLIRAWQPKADQSDYSRGYSASDLMTAAGTAQKDDGKLFLSFSLTHRMAMAVIRIPKIVYKFTNTTGTKIDDYEVSSPAAFNAPAIPYAAADGSYRYIVRPGQSSATLNGSYFLGMKEFTVNTDGIASGSYKTFKINGTDIVELPHKLQVGDFLFEDGTILGRDKKLSPYQAQKVAAIVFWTPSETDEQGRETPARLTDDRIMALEHPECTHGLALSIRDVSAHSTWQNTFSMGSISSWQHMYFSHKNKSLFVYVYSGDGPTDNINRIYGYQNTIVLRAYNEYCKDRGYNLSIIQPVAGLDEFIRSIPAPKGSTGWFIPSVKELFLLCLYDKDDVVTANPSFLNDKKTALNNSLKAANGTQLGYPDYFWSSTEDRFNTGSAYCVDASYARISSTYKSDQKMVRAVCAF